MGGYFNCTHIKFYSISSVEAILVLLRSAMVEQNRGFYYWNQLQYFVVFNWIFFIHRNKSNECCKFCWSSKLFSLSRVGTCFSCLALNIFRKSHHNRPNSLIRVLCVKIYIWMLRMRIKFASQIFVVDALSGVTFYARHILSF